MQKSTTMIENPTTTITDYITIKISQTANGWYWTDPNNQTHGPFTTAEASKKWNDRSKSYTQRRNALIPEAIRRTRHEIKEKTDPAKWSNIFHSWMDRLAEDELGVNSTWLTREHTNKKKKKKLT
jgi:hypothetical protein